jgi:hypothetical protein
VVLEGAVDRTQIPVVVVVAVPLMAVVKHHEETVVALDSFLSLSGNSPCKSINCIFSPEDGL